MDDYSTALALIMAALAVVAITQYDQLYSNENETAYELELMNNESYTVIIEYAEAQIHDENQTLVAQGELEDAPVEIESGEYEDAIIKILTEESLEELDERYQDDDLFNVTYHVKYKKDLVSYEDRDTLELTKAEILQLIEEVENEIG
ncbi:MAG: hypothetical protein ACLFVP_10150 [Candidatus Bathyarchaeia archaeon]